MNKLQKKLIRLLAVLTATVMLAACGSEASVSPDTSEPAQTPGTTAAKETPETTVPETVSQAETPEETTAPAETEENHEGQKKSYLTGLWTDEALVNRRPVAIMLSNIKQAVPQTGISRAAIIYEAQVEGMITRLMGLFEDYDDLEKIGSVRSARTYFVFWAKQWDAVYAHFGQCNYANVYLDQTDNLNGVLGIGNTVYYRTTDRKAPHNAYASGKGLNEGIAKMEYRTDHEADYTRGVFQFADKPGDVTLSDGMDATYVYPGYRSNKAYFEYDENTKQYLRFQYDGKQIDDMTKEQLAVDNIVIQYCDYSHYYDTAYLWIEIWDEGDGYYITQGKAIPIRWKGGVEYAPTTYYDMDGNEIQLNPGKTWVCTVVTENQKDTEIR